MPEAKNKKIKKIFIHHSGIPQKDNQEQFRSINNYHQARWDKKSSLGFYAGFNYVISKAGRSNKARKEGEETAAIPGYNNGEFLHICLEGNFNIEYPSPAQIFKLKEVIRFLVSEYNLTKEDVLLAREVSDTPSPGHNIDKVFIDSLADEKWTEEEEEAKRKEGEAAKKTPDIVIVETRLDKIEEKIDSIIQHINKQKEKIKTQSSVDKK